MLNPIVAKPLKESLLSMKGFSKRAVEEHYKLYNGYVKKYNEIADKLKNVDLSSANQTYSDLRSLKTELTFAIGGVKNHEIYFDILGGAGSTPGEMTRSIQGWGNLDEFKAEVKATGLAARGWVWFAYDHDRDFYFIYLGDAQNTYPVWNATPVFALDTYEHAYWMDFGSDRGAYIDAFFENVDWNEIENRVAAVKK